MTRAHEVNFDGIVGPTHNYAGLSFGNVASIEHTKNISHPRRAALEGLAKMKFLADLGVKQAVLPPQPRPDIATLRRLGFSGSDERIVEKAWRKAPELLAACYSASSMWTANAATVSPSADSADGRIHFTPANLLAQFHRSLEPVATAAALRAIFPDEAAFAHHPPLPAAAHLSDEGAANHLRLARSHGEAGLEIFVYGRRAFHPEERQPVRFPARQTREASEAVARLHQLDPARALFVQQHPAAIDAGAFHNDVVAVANENVLLYHELAFLDGPAVIGEIRRRFERFCGEELIAIEIPNRDLPLDQAVGSYLFNSQLVSLPDGTMSLISPMECRESPAAHACIEQLLSAGTPIRSAHYVEVRQSMHNGGGPACLRLRVVLTEEQLSCVSPRMLLDDALYARLTEWVNRHYRETLRPEDLADPLLMAESRRAMEALTRIIGFGPTALRK